MRNGKGVGEYTVPRRDGHTQPIRRVKAGHNHNNNNNHNSNNYHNHNTVRDYHPHITDNTRYLDRVYTMGEQSGVEEKIHKCESLRDDNHIKRQEISLREKLQEYEQESPCKDSLGNKSLPVKSSEYIKFLERTILQISHLNGELEKELMDVRREMTVCKEALQLSQKFSTGNMIISPRMIRSTNREEVVLSPSNDSRKIHFEDPQQLHGSCTSIRGWETPEHSHEENDIVLYEESNSSTGNENVSPSKISPTRTLKTHTMTISREGPSANSSAGNRHNNNNNHNHNSNHNNNNNLLRVSGQGRQSTLMNDVPIPSASTREKYNYQSNNTFRGISRSPGRREKSEKLIDALETLKRSIMYRCNHSHQARAERTRRNANTQRKNMWTIPPSKQQQKQQQQTTQMLSSRERGSNTIPNEKMRCRSLSMGRCGGGVGGNPNSNNINSNSNNNNISSSRRNVRAGSRPNVRGNRNLSAAAAAVAPPVNRSSSAAGPTRIRSNRRGNSVPAGIVNTRNNNNNNNNNTTRTARTRGMSVSPSGRKTARATSKIAATQGDQWEAQQQRYWEESREILKELERFLEEE